MANRVEGNIAFEDADVMRGQFLNFSGRETQYNPAGRRNFCVVLPSSEVADELEEKGWHVKRTRPDEDGNSTPYLPVSVRFDIRPPKVHLITCRVQNGKVEPRTNTQIGEDEIGMLDWADIINVDVVISPYNWTNNGQSGCRAYLKTLYVKIEEDQYADKYSEWLGDDVVPFDVDD